MTQVPPSNSGSGAGGEVAAAISLTAMMNTGQAEQSAARLTQSIRLSADQSKIFTADMKNLQSALSNTSSFSDLSNKFKILKQSMNDTALTGRVTSESFAQMKAGIAPSLDSIGSSMDRLKLKGTLQAQMISDLSNRMVSLGKNFQWTGRQLTVGLTVPLLGFADQAAKAFVNISTAYTQVAKLLGQPSTNTGFMQGLEKQGTQIAEQFHVVIPMVANAMQDALKAGVDKADLTSYVAGILRDTKLQGLDVSEVEKWTNAVRQNFIPAGTAMSDQILILKNDFNQFNAIANASAVPAQKLIDALPSATKLAGKFGLSLNELTGLLAGAYASGINVTTMATGMDRILARLTTTTSSMNKSWDAVFAGGNKDAKDSLETITSTTHGMNELFTIVEKIHALPPNIQLKAANDIVGVRQGKSLVEVTDQLGAIVNSGKGVTAGLQEIQSAASGISNAVIKQGRSYEVTFNQQTKGMTDAQKALVASLITEQANAKGASEDLKTILSSPQEQLAAFKVKFQAIMGDIGSIIFPVFLKVLGVVNNIIQRFDALPRPIKESIIAFGGILAAIGPINLLFGQGLEVIGSMGRAVAGLIPKFKEMSAAEIEAAGGTGAFKNIFSAGGQFFADGKKISPKAVASQADRLDQNAAGLRRAAKYTDNAEAKNSMLKEAEASEVEAEKLRALAAANNDVAKSEIERAAATKQAAVTSEESAVAAKEEASGSKEINNAERYSPSNRKPSLQSDVLGQNPLSDNQSMFAKHNKELEDIQKKFKQNPIDVQNSLLGGGSVTAAEDAGKNLTKGIEKGIEGGKGGILSKLKGIFSNIPLLGKGGGEEGSIFAGLFAPLVEFLPVILAVGAAIAAIVIFAKALANNWKTVYGEMKPGIDGLMHGFDTLKDAVAGVVKIFSDAIGKVFSNGGGSSASGATGFWTMLGKAVGGAANVIGSALGYIADAFKFIEPVISNVAKYFADVIGFWIHLLSGDWKDALRDAGRAIIDLFGRPIAAGLDAIKDIVLDFLQWVVDRLGGLTGAVGGFLSHIHVLGIDKVGNALKDAKANLTDLINTGKNLDFTTLLNNADNSLADTGNKITDTVSKVGIKLVHVMNDSSKNAADAMANNLSDGASKFADFMGELKSQIQSEMDQAKQSAQDAFDVFQTNQKDTFYAQGDAKVAVFDAELKKIDEVKKAQDRLAQEEDYLNKKKTLEETSALDRENYMRQRALAIYQGRIDDARGLDLQEQKRQMDVSKQFSDLNTSRNKQIADNKTSDKTDMINAQKSAMQKMVDAQRKGFDLMQSIAKKSFAQQLADLTQFLPKNPAEYQKMLNNINGLVQKFGGAPVFADTGRMTVENFQKAVDNTFKAIDEKNYWAGKGSESGYGWLSGFEKTVPIITAGMAAAGQAAADAYNKAFNGGGGNSLNGAVPDKGWIDRLGQFVMSTSSKGEGTANAGKLFGQISGAQNDPAQLKNILSFLGIIDDKGNVDPGKIFGAFINPTFLNNQGSQGSLSSLWYQIMGGSGANAGSPSLGGVPMRKRHMGGWIKMHDGGFPPLQTDEIPTILQSGEYVINKNAAANLGGGTLDALNNNPMTNIQKTMSSGWQNVAQDTSGTWDGINQVLNDEYDKMTSNTKGTWDNIKKITSDTLSSIYTNNDTARGKNTVLWNDTYSKTNRAWNNTYSAMSGWSDKITTKMAGLPNKWGGQLNPLGRAFGGPIALTTNGVINFFVGQLNSFGQQTGMGKLFKELSVPKFHTGGIVGKDINNTSLGDGLKADEQVAVLKKGEGVIPTNIMKSIGMQGFYNMIGGKNTGDPAGGGGATFVINTPLDFAHALESTLGAPSGGGNDSVLTAWQQAEGSPGWGYHNPYNTMMRGFGERPGVVGISDFPNWQEGIAATAAGIRLSYYKAILADIMRDAPAGQTAVDIEASPWASGHYGWHPGGIGNIERILGSKGFNPSLVGGGGGSGSSAPTVDVGAYVQKMETQIANIMKFIKDSGVKGMMFGASAKAAGAAKNYMDLVAAVFNSQSGSSGGVSGGNFPPLGPVNPDIVSELTAWKRKPGSYKALEAIMNFSGVPHGVSSDFRPGAVGASTGKQSFHAIGEAVDFVGPSLMGIWQFWNKYIPQLTELFYSNAPIFKDTVGSLVHPISQMDAIDRANHYSHVHVALGTGGIVKHSPKGTIIRAGEDGNDEAVIPLPKFDIDKYIKGFSAPQMISAVVKEVQQQVTTSGAAGGGKMDHGNCVHEERIYNTISVDTFIGTEEWFKSMMNEYNVKVLPANQRAKGNISRVITSYSTQNKRFT